MTNQPLKEYCDCLKLFASKKFELVNSKTPGVDIEQVAQLIELDWLSVESNNSSYDGKEYTGVRINPVGAAVLAEWEAILRASSISGRVMANIERLAWLVIGVLLSLIPQLLLK
jgi:hypothetical protein